MLNHSSLPKVFFRSIFLPKVVKMTLGALNISEFSILVSCKIPKLMNRITVVPGFGKDMLQSSAKLFFLGNFML
jgi:hypothetical protein